MTLRSVLYAAVGSCLVSANWLGAETVWVDELDLSPIAQQNLGTVEIGRGPLPLKIPTHGIVLLRFVRASSAQSTPHTSSVRPLAPALGHE